MKNVRAESHSYDQILNLDYKHLIEFSKMDLFKKNILSFLAFRASHNELQKLKHLFTAVDTSGDGSISLEEFENCFKNFNIKNDNLDIKDLFNQIDINKNGFIDYTEFMAALIDEKKILTEDRIYEAFRMFDKDNSGKISHAEFLKVLNTGNEEFDFSNLLKETISAFDANKDGEIDYSEFCQMAGLELKKKSSLEEFISNLN